MSFGEFYCCICDHLKQGYNWRCAATYLFDHPHLLNIIYEQYNQHGPMEDWGEIVQATALLVDQGDQLVA